MTEANEHEITALLQAWRARDDQALDQLPPRVYRGLGVEETAEVLQVSQDTVARDWRLARAWLLREMSGAVDGA